MKIMLKPPIIAQHVFQINVLNISIICSTMILNVLFNNCLCFLTDINLFSWFVRPNYRSGCQVRLTCNFCVGKKIEFLKKVLSANDREAAELRAFVNI